MSVSHDRGFARKNNKATGTWFAILWGMSNNRQDLCARSFALAERLLDLYPKLASTNIAFAHLAGQLFDAGSGIGALIEEAQVGNSKRDMAAKYAIALREAREANYWARLAATNPRWKDPMAPIIQETKEFIAMLTVTVRKLRSGE